MSDLPHVIDVTAGNFESAVFEKSKDVLVVVDFWATWCQPCQSLLPVMHKLAETYAGKFILAKVDIDQNQELAQMFGVRSVPTVKFLKDGKLVDEFTGVMAESEIRAKLDSHIELESDRAFLDAFALYQQGAEDQTLRQQAIQNMIQACNADPHNTRIRIQLAKILVHESQFDEAKTILQALPEPEVTSDDVKSMLMQIEMAENTRDLPDIETLLAQVSANGDDHAARLQLARQLIVLGDYENALDQLFEIIKRDREYENDIGRVEMLKLFDMLSSAGKAEQELASRYRRKLAHYLY